jgi:hypothetical protein
MSEDLELPGDIKALLRSERAFSEIPAASRTHIARRLAACGGVFGASAYVAKKAVLGGWKGILVKGTWIVAVGGGAFALHHATQSGDATDVAPITAVAHSTVSAERTPIQISHETPIATPVASHAPVQARTIHPVDDEATLAAEQGILDKARDAIARGEPEQALDMTALHASQFARGTLAEERYAIRIRALARLGRKSEAQSLLDQLRARYPHSFLLQGATDDVAASRWQAIEPTETIP